MAKNRKFTVKIKRRRDKKTDYKMRLRLLSSKLPRVVIRSSLNNIQIQLIEYKPKGDIILLTVRSKDLIKLGWKYNSGNIPSSYLTGLLFGKKALALKHKEAILDIGLKHSVNGSRIYAALKGIIDAGFKVPHNNKIFPSEDRIKGKHIIDHFKKTRKQYDFKQLEKTTIIEKMGEDLEKIKASITK